MTSTTGPTLASAMSVPGGRRYHPGINGLRGILASHVVFVHFLMAFLPSSLTSFDSLMFPADSSPHWLVPLLQLRSYRC